MIGLLNLSWRSAFEWLSFQGTELVFPFRNEPSDIFFLTNLLGPEVVEQALRVLEVISGACTDVEIKLESHPFGGCAIDATGEPLPESTLKACQEADAILLGESLISSVQCYLGI